MNINPDLLLIIFANAVIITFGIRAFVLPSKARKKYHEYIKETAQKYNGQTTEDILQFTEDGTTFLVQFRSGYKFIQIETKATVPPSKYFLMMQPERFFSEIFLGKLKTNIKDLFRINTNFSSIDDLLSKDTQEKIVYFRKKDTFNGYKHNIYYKDTKFEFCGDAPTICKNKEDFNNFINTAIILLKEIKEKFNV